LGGLPATLDIIDTDSTLQPEPYEGSHCAFCDYHGKLTGEHVWPQRLIKALLPPGTLSATTRSGALPPDAITSWTTSALEGEVNIDCDKCNNSRLEAIEVAATPYVAAMAAGRQGPLDQSAQRAVAAFALRMFAVAQYTTLHRGVPRSHREYLVTHGEPPVTARVWIWEYGGSGTSTIVRSRSKVIVWPGDHGAERPNAYQGILRVGRLILEVGATTDDRRYPVAPQGPGVAHLVIWPPHPRRSIVNWPPPVTTNDQAFDLRVAAMDSEIEHPVPPGWRPEHV
jgi:hypothetical protein